MTFFYFFFHQANLFTGQRGAALEHVRHALGGEAAPECAGPQEAAAGKDGGGATRRRDFASALAERDKVPSSCRHVHWFVAVCRFSASIIKRKARLAGNRAGDTRHLGVGSESFPALLYPVARFLYGFSLLSFYQMKVNRIGDPSCISVTP